MINQNLQLTLVCRETHSSTSLHMLTVPELKPRLERVKMLLNKIARSQISYQTQLLPLKE